MSVQIARDSGRVMKSGVCLLIAALMFAGSGNALPKKDVSDPVLQEIIASFSLRMPRFIDKYGEGVYVSDEVINRASLMHAFYEYDKSIRLNKKEYVSREEYNDLCAKLALLERKGVGMQAKGKLDIMEVINGLGPNMGILLDNSLADSKVFMSLKHQVESPPSGGADSDTNVGTLVEVDILSRRMDMLEKELQVGGRGAAPGADAVTRQEVQDIRDKLERIERNALPSNTVVLTREVRENLAKTERSLADMARRLTAIESSAGDNDTSQYTDAARKTDAQTQDTLVRLNQRIDVIEKNVAAEGQGSSRSIQEMQDIRDKLERIEKNALPSNTVVLTREVRENLAKTERSLADMARRLTAIESSAGDNDTSQYTDAARKTDAKTHDTLARLNQRINTIEKSVAAEGRDSSRSIDEARQASAQAQNELVRLNRRIEEIERNAVFEGRSASNAEDIRQYTSGLTKMALGLGMVAAFFIAR